MAGTPCSALATSWLWPWSDVKLLGVRALDATGVRVGAIHSAYRCTDAELYYSDVRVLSPLW